MASLLCLEMLVFDGVKFVQLILNETVWSHTFKKKYQASQPDSSQNLEDPNSKDNTNAHLNTTAYAATAEQAKTSTVIDYEATFQEIELCHHQVEILSASLRLDQQVYRSRASRCTFLMHVLRINLFQCLVVACQYTNSLVLVSLLMIEVTKVAVTVLLYLRLKHLKNLLVLVMEVLNSLFLGVFMLICLWVNLSEQTEGEAYQTAAIYTIITSCICEYLLLISYLVITVYNAIKNRKSSSKNKRGNKPSTSFIKYSIVRADPQQLLVQAEVLPQPFKIVPKVETNPRPLKKQRLGFKPKIASIFPLTPHENNLPARRPKVKRTRDTRVGLK